MRLLLKLFLLITIALVPMSVHASGSGAHIPTVPDKLSNTLDELAARFDPKICADCHEQIYEEWTHSGHGRAFSTERVLQTWRTWLKQGADKETHPDWDGSKITRMSIKSHCLWCHAPQIKYATDSLVENIIDMIITAVDDPSKTKRSAAVSELSKLNLNCYGCHNMFALQDGYWGNKGEKGTIYGPRGETDPADPKHAEFKTVKSDHLTSVNFCARCHHGCPDSVPFWQCKTLYTSYVENYALKGGKNKCQDCHMKPASAEDPKSHKFPGVHDKDFFAGAIDINIKSEATHFINNFKNELTPTLCLDVVITSHSGHGLPNG